MLLFVGNKKVAIINQKRTITNKTINVTYVTLYSYTYSIIEKRARKGKELIQNYSSQLPKVLEYEVTLVTK